MGLYSISNYPTVFVASVNFSEQEKTIQILQEANRYKGTAFIIVNDLDEMVYKYDATDGQITVENDEIGAKLNLLLKRDNNYSLVVKEPTFASQLVSSQNAELSFKLTNILSSYSKLLTGLSPIVVLYASDGGVGESMAIKLQSELEKRKINTICQSCDEYSFDDITTQQTIIFFMSTSGQGKFPLNAKNFWNKLSQLGDDTSLNNLRFSVFGLGDSQFWKPPLGKIYFCKPARDLDRKLAAMGALQLLPLCCGDDQDVGGPQEALLTWLPALYSALGVNENQMKPNSIDKDIGNTDKREEAVNEKDSKKELTKIIREKGIEMGLSSIAFTKLEKSECGPAYEEWVTKGFHGEMGYLSREDAVQKRKNPTLLSPGTISAIVATLNYDPKLDPEPYSDPSAAIFARYAQGEDYHDILKPRLMKLQQFIQTLPEVQSKSGRVYVDTGPILERELARKAGLGWFGKNTMMIMPKKGSYFFLGVLLIDIELEYDKPFEKDLCGGCSACLPACPTGALLGKDPNTGAPIMDARRCISYLTIEQKGPIPRHFRKLIGNRIYGCDICQEACPWNQYSTMTTEPAFIPPENKIKIHGEKLVDLLSLTQVQFSKKFKGSAIKRTKRRGLLRNVAVALGNWKNTSAIPALSAALQDEEALVRGHVAWALGQIGGEEAIKILLERLSQETDDYVKEEISLALQDNNTRV